MSDWRYITKGTLPKTDEIHLRERCDGESAEKVFEIMFKNRRELREYFLNEIERIEKLLAEKDKEIMAYRSLNREWDSLRDFIKENSSHLDAGQHYGDIAINKIKDLEKLLAEKDKEIKWFSKILSGGSKRLEKILAEKDKQLNSAVDLIKSFIDTNYTTDDVYYLCEKWLEQFKESE